jgi:hypothetical protein
VRLDIRRDQGVRRAGHHGLVVWRRHALAVERDRQAGGVRAQRQRRRSWAEQHAGDVTQAAGVGSSQAQLDVIPIRVPAYKFAGGFGPSRCDTRLYARTRLGIRQILVVGCGERAAGAADVLDQVLVAVGWAVAVVQHDRPAERRGRQRAPARGRWRGRRRRSRRRHATSCWHSACRSPPWAACCPR